MRVLVMGGTQFNGLALVNELARGGFDVTVLNRGKTEAQLPRHVRRLTADRSNAAQLRDVLGGANFDAVVDVSAYLPSDVELMLDIFRGRLAHYIFISSTVIYAPSKLLPITERHALARGAEQNEYGRNKIAAEQILFEAHRRHGFPGTVVALSMSFGPNNILPDREQRMFRRFLQGREIMIPGDGTALQQIGHAADQARALRQLLGRPVSFGQRYNLSGGDYFSQEGYVDCFAEVLGREARKVFIPPALMEDLWAGRREVQLPRVQARVDTRGSERPDPVIVNRFMLSMLVQSLAPHLHHWNQNVIFSIEKLRRHAEWEPEFNLRGAVQQTWDWYQQSPQAVSEFDFAFEDELLRLCKAAA